MVMEIAIECGECPARGCHFDTASIMLPTHTILAASAALPAAILNDFHESYTESINLVIILMVSAKFNQTDRLAFVAAVPYM